jgi:CHAT domain-containing protein
MALLDQVTRGGGEFAASASATDQVRLFGGVLPPLLGSGREARAVSALLERAGVKPTLLAGVDAKAPALLEAVSSGRCRYLHLATHGLMGSVDRPLDASLALTQPEKPTPDDIGFLRLEDLISKWGGRLEGCELVVLSACDTQRGARRGDTVMSLPLGFFFAGARTVIASLWKVDDTATALLMTRFYENLLGTFKESREVPGRAYAAGEALPKADALREAKQWLRSLTGKERDQHVRRLGLQSATVVAKASEQERGIADKTVKAGPLVRGDARPYEHPYYWAAFILIGDPGRGQPPGN